MSDGLVNETTLQYLRHQVQEIRGNGADSGQAAQDTKVNSCCALGFIQAWELQIAKRGSVESKSFIQPRNGRIGNGNTIFR